MQEDFRVIYFRLTGKTSGGGQCWNTTETLNSGAATKHGKLSGERGGKFRGKIKHAHSPPKDTARRLGELDAKDVGSTLYMPILGREGSALILTVQRTLYRPEISTKP